MDFLTYLFDPDTTWVPENIEDHLDDDEDLQQIKGDLQYEYLVENFYTTLFFSSHISSGIKMLENNYIAYTGEKNDFLSFVEWSLDVYPNYDPFKTNQKFLTLTQIPIVKKRVNEWIDGKRAELKEGKSAIVNNKRPAPKLTKFNKPILTQKQTAILFRMFREKKIFVLEGLTKDRYSEILAELTGYSNNTLRTSFSDKGYDSISSNREDYQQLITILNEILDEIKKISP